MNPAQPTPDRTVFRSLWKAARQRRIGRARRQQELLGKADGRRSGRSLVGTGWVTVLLLPLYTVLNLAMAFLLFIVVDEGPAPLGDRAEPGGLRMVKQLPDRGLWDSDPETWIAETVGRNARWRSDKLGGTIDSHQRILEEQARTRGPAGFLVNPTHRFGSSERMPQVFLPVIGMAMAAWFLMVTLQDEGIELDTQRSRHPLWEWLLSHPVRPWAAVSVELLGPVLVNPILWTAPAFLCGLWSMVFGFGLSTVLTGILASLPLIVAASTLHKAVEMAILLRCSPRVRGGLLGIVSWLGLLMQLGSLPLVTVATPVTRFLMWVTGRVGDRWDFTAVRWVLEGWGPSPSLWQAALSTTTVGIALTALAGALVAWAIRHGLQGRSADPVEPRAGTTPQRFLLRDPVHRKELLWFRRDAGAWVQTLLVPMTLVLYNLFQMRLLLKGAVGTWHGVCGIATLVGSFFLASLGPKSLASEGSALWIPLTWPIGLERLLETKARFWWMLSLGISGIGFAMAWFRFPEDALPIALVAVAWMAFSLALAWKSVTLVQVPTSSGEIDQIPQARQWVVFLGTMSFSGGLLSGNWHAMVLGLSFSILSAAALWQDLRVRLPHLFDPWSEPIPEAPTLLHSLLAILGMVEAVAIIGSVARTFATTPLQWMVTTVTYGVVGGITWMIVSLFLSGRGVRPESLWTWEQGEPSMPGTLRRIVVGVGLGAILGVAALGYQEFVAGWPALVGEREDAQRLLAENGVHRGWLLATVVILAPWAEELLFRGMLFRALHRAWGPTRALWVSAAFFAVYHPPVAWLPVFCMGLASAWLFRRSGRLIPCALLHMTYNAVVAYPWWLHEVVPRAPSP